MSNEFAENPVFASKLIPTFTHYEEIDEELADNLDFQELNEIRYLLLPVIDQVPENRRGVARLFISNKGSLAINFYIY